MLDGFLRSPTDAGYLFYGADPADAARQAAPVAAARASCSAATVAFGFVVHAIVGGDLAIAPWRATRAADGWIGTCALGDRAGQPDVTFGNICFVALLCLVVVLVQVHATGGDRSCWCPTLYLAACVLGGAAVAKPVDHPQILLGAILIVMMAARPAGLLGARRVEVV